MNVAVVGLGAMGSRIARRLADAGNDVVVWNRDRAKAEGFAHVADSPRAAAEGAEAAIVMVADPGAVRAVVDSEDGVARADTTVVQMSTVGPADTAWLAERAPKLVDAPVLGSVSEVEQGTLSVFAGAADDDLARVRPLLETLGTVIHVGGVGAGTAAKLVANSTLFGITGVLGEALRIADALGLERATAFDVLATTPIAAQSERRRPAIESGDYPARFSLALARKDADLIAEVEAGLRLAEAARSWLADAGDGAEDYSSVLRKILER